MTFQSRWTEELKAQAKQLWTDHSATQIAEILNAQHGTALTRNAVVGLMHRAGLGASVKTKSHPQDNYAPEIIRKRTYQPRRKPVLKIVSNGAGTGLRIIETVISDLPLFACLEVQSRDITIDQLGPDDCRYLAGDGAPWLYCGHPVQEKSSYCPYHHARVFNKPIPAKRDCERPDFSALQRKTRLSTIEVLNRSHSGESA